MNTDFYLLFDRVEIQGANCISSPLTYGFPALNGFLGAIHALQRRLPQDCGLTLGGVLIACHRCSPQIFRADAYSDATFIQSRNPLKKDGSTASIIEEGKTDLTVSLVVEVGGIPNDIRRNKEQRETLLQSLLQQQRIAGGSVRHIERTALYESYQAEELKAALFPAYILADAGNDLAAITQELQLGCRVTADKDGGTAVCEDRPTGLPPQPEATALDALFATAQFFHLPPDDEHPEWHSYHIRQGRGWLVPIPVGYQAIAPEHAAGVMQHVRNPEYPSRYVETVYSLGKWLFPNKLSDGLHAYFWRYAPPQDNLYLITQTTRP